MLVTDNVFGYCEVSADEMRDRVAERVMLLNNKSEFELQSLKDYFVKHSDRNRNSMMEHGAQDLRAAINSLRNEIK